MNQQNWFSGSKTNSAWGDSTTPFGQSSKFASTKPSTTPFGQSSTFASTKPSTTPFGQSSKFASTKPSTTPFGQSSTFASTKQQKESTAIHGQSVFELTKDKSLSDQTARPFGSNNTISQQQLPSHIVNNYFTQQNPINNFYYVPPAQVHNTSPNINNYYNDDYTGIDSPYGGRSDIIFGTPCIPKN